ncbi:MAG: bifunctional folylpolyglutamate synthase/ dihydrofolate synthase [Gammaproteobacteria bacterium]|nr:MAG: bifunctional folylpolyglutamate synthase/ dihydrofolate synthase [Gammaproteobacteria bacterium]
MRNHLSANSIANSVDNKDRESTELSNWLKKIERFHPEEIELGLNRIKDIASSLGLLKPKAKVIIVAGTNGKGSCVATLESLALQSQLKVGCYTSPHLLVFNERIRINGSNVLDKELNQAFRQIEKCRDEVPLTFFEFTTLAALQVFSTKYLDLIVLEVGLGGRLDAVNIINPDVAIITTIAKDHTDWLGDTLEEIAAEKAGVYRTNSLNLVGDDKTLELLKSSITNSDTLFRLIEDDELDSILALESIADPQINCYKLQKQNIELALASFINLFKNILQPIDLKLIFKSIQLSGRFQIQQNSPLVITDVAHNPQAASNLLNQMQSLTCNGSRIAICGLMSDKATKEYIQILDKSIEQWVFVDLPLKRGALATDLNRSVSQLNKELPIHQCFSNMQLSTDYVSEIINETDHLYIIGSFITVSEFLKLEKHFN